MSRVLATRIGEVIAGRYELTQLLGAGGMGAVFEARQIAMDRSVAIKIIHGHLTGNREYVERFHREMKATVRVRHENSIHVYDYGQTELGELYLVMELVDGRSLAEILRDEPTFGEERAIRVARGIARALGAIHHEGVIHRDLKPGNVMLVDRYGESDIVKVMDFGIARLLSTDAHEAPDALTDTGSIIGTPLYMSPEQIMGRPVDGRSDLYALGIILYQCLAGGVPFFDETPTRVLMMHAKDPPEPLSKRLGRRVSPDLEALVLDLLAKAPRSRPQTAADVVDRLDACSRAFASEQAEAKAGRGRTATGGRPRWMVPVLAVAVFALLGLSVALFWPRETPAPPDATPVVAAADAVAPTSADAAASSREDTTVSAPPDAAAPIIDVVAAIAPPPEPSPDTGAPEATAPPGAADGVEDAGTTGTLAGDVASGEEDAVAPEGGVVVAPDAGTEAVHDKALDVAVPVDLAGTSLTPGRAALAAALVDGGHPALPGECLTEVGGLLDTLTAAARQLRDGRVGAPRAEDESALAALDEVDPVEAGAAYWLLLARARLYVGRGDAVAAARRATAVCPDAALAHNVLGNALQRVGRLPDAESAYRKALALANEYVAPRMNLGLLALQRGDADGSLAMFDDVLSRDPANAGAHAARGHALRTLGRAEEAQAAYCRAASLDAKLKPLCP